MRRKLLQNAEQGLPHGSVRPFGDEPDKITLRESEAKVVWEIVDRYLSGCVDPVADSVAERLWHPAGGGQVVANLRGTPNLCSGRIAGLREHHGQVIGPAKWPAIITPAEAEIAYWPA